MATHVWNQVHENRDGMLHSRFQTETLLTAALALDAAAGKLHNPAAVYTWVGYAAETFRQSGRGRWAHHGISVMGTLWSGACRSNHRYSFGKNAGNYERAGRALVKQLGQWWIDWQRGNTVE